MTVPIEAKPSYRRVPVWGWVVGGVVALGVLCCAGSIVLALVLPEPTPAAAPSSSPPSPPPTHDRGRVEVAPSSPSATATTADGPAAGWDAFAASGAVPPSVLAVVDDVRWDGLALVAETSIYNDSDAPAAARAVCMAVSAYGLTEGEFRPLQVLGSAGELLVSRHSLGEQCVWRG